MFSSQSITLFEDKLIHTYWAGLKRILMNHHSHRDQGLRLECLNVRIYNALSSSHFDVM